MKHILHVEDDTDFHFYVDTMLSGFVNVTSVCTAKEFREALVGFEFDLFILDLVLKDGSGASIARELRSEYPDTPIIILSAHDIITDFVDDADATFVKTVLDFDKFIETVKTLLAKTENREAGYMDISPQTV